MRLKTHHWFLLSLVLFGAAAWFWHLGDQRVARRHSAPAANAVSATNASAGQPFQLQVTNSLASASVVPLLATVTTNAPNARPAGLLAYRLSNTQLPLGELARSDRALLLRNVLLNTANPARPEIPAHLRAQGDPGAYIVQSRGAITASFREWLTGAGAEIVSYVPNNAFLIRAQPGAMGNIRGSAWVAAVEPLEPYYKLDSLLLPLAVERQFSPYEFLNVVSFPREAAAAQAQLERLGAQVVGAAQTTVFGDVLTVRAPANALAAIAQICEVQLISVHVEKRIANDLSRVKLRVSTNSPITRPPDSHYGAPTPADHLTGNNLLVGVNDTGVDATHPDLTGRIEPGSLTTDFDGHGTHVIGSFIGNGAGSPLSASNAMGSSNGAIFSGIAPLARAYVQDFHGPDSKLQLNTALKKILISNNSWGYPINDYDIFAASYDAAVRDSSPGETGEQEVAYVFAAGNDGGGDSQGLNGIPGSILSPATAKNVISVGASDLPRFITNTVYRNPCLNVTNVTTGPTGGPPVTNIVLVCQTNQPWLPMTDSDNQVAPFSARGNVGIGVEGPFGRFKPDVIAPGGMVVSARGRDFQEESNAFSTTVYRYNSVPAPPKVTNLFALNIPGNAVSVTILALSNLTVQPHTDILVAADIDAVPTAAPGPTPVTLVPPALRSGTLFYTVANANTSNTVVFDLVVILTVTNDVGNYYEELKKLNEPLKPNYRYESGTSMAAPHIAGLLALFQEFLGKASAVPPSPALLKALVINGARSLSPSYNLDTHAVVNHQGWGVANISNSIPSGLDPAGTTGPMRFFDQSISNALITGASNTYVITVPAEARSYPLRVTLVWTDPPGNPLVGVKLVNDLNLTVDGVGTNLAVSGTNSVTNSSSLLYVGNNFLPGSDFTDPVIVSTSDTNVPAATNLTQVVGNLRDYVNNVENVYIRPPLAASYNVVVKGHRVNVNSLNSHSNAIGQDYALVISSGNVAPSNNVNLVVTGPVPGHDPAARIAALARATNANSAGLLNQRVGASSALITSTNGATNQWCFFTYQNVPTANFTNVVILTFLSPELSLPRYREADIDLYVARDPSGTNLFQLDPAAVSLSTKSTGRTGTEFVLFSNAQPNEVFYIGVKSEDQQAANFSIFAASSDVPFNSRDTNGNIIARALAAPVEIPDGTPDAPGGTNLFVIVFEPNVAVRRVYVTNSIFHEEAGDLIGILSHRDPVDGSEAAVTLNNHRTWNGPDISVYDDSDEGDIINSVPVDGPGTLRSFGGQQAFGMWNFSISDNALFHTGSVQELTLVIEPASTNDTNAVFLRRPILPGRFLYVPVSVPLDAYNMEICVSDFIPNSPLLAPIEIYVKQGDYPDQGYYDYATNAQPPGLCFDIGLGDTPPLAPGRWVIGIYNPLANPIVTLTLQVTFSRKTLPGPYVTWFSTNTPMALLEDAVTNSTIFVTNFQKIADLNVGLRVDHARASDLVFHLVSPAGTRLLLMENRGRTNARGIGVNFTNVVTNVVRTLINDGFDFADGAGFGSRAAPNVSWNLGEIFSGWRVDSDNIETVRNGYGMLVTPHSGSNAIDLIGYPTPGHPTSGPGSVSSNVITRVGSLYRLAFVYCKNPGGPPSQTARVELNSLPATNFTYGLANDYFNLNWQPHTMFFRATSVVTKVGFRQVNPLNNAVNGGMFIDSVRLDEVLVVSNAFIYTTFTENTNLTVTPIKYGEPPYTNSPNPRQAFLLKDSFESLSPYVLASPYGLPAGSPGLNTDISGWHVDLDNVDVVSVYNGYPADSGLYSIDINGYLPGQVSTNLLTQAGQDYQVDFAFMKNPDPTILSAQASVRVVGSTLAILTNNILTATNGASWASTSMVFRADGSSTRLILQGVTPGLGGVLFDSFTVRQISTNLEFNPYFLPEESLRPLVGERAYGPWTLEVLDSRLGPGAGSLSNALVAWKLEFTFPQTNPPLIFLTNGQTVVTNVAFGETVYFSIDVPCPAGVVTNTLVNLTGNGGLDLIFNQFTLPTNGPNDLFLLNNVLGTNQATLFIGTPPLISATRYYLAVQNTDPTRTNRFSLRLDVVCASSAIVPVDTNTYCTNITASPAVHYYSYQMPSNVIAVRFETFGADGNVDLAVKSFGVPSGGSGLSSANGGTTSEIIQVTTNTLGFPVTQGTWYIAVNNRDAVTVNYCLKITEFYPGAVTILITNAACVTYTVAGNAVAYHVVSIPVDATNVLFSATGLTGDVDMYLKAGQFPATNYFDYASINPGIVPETRTLPAGFFTPGTNYYVAIVNVTGAPVNYCLQVLVTSSTPFGPTIKADASSYNAGTMTLKWSAPSSQAFQVEYTDTLAPASWHAITNVITSGSGEFQFIDDGSQTGGSSAQRFYRLRRVP